MTQLIREKWLQAVDEALKKFKGEVEERLQTRVTVEWDKQVDVVHPDTKIATRLPQHMPYVVSAGHKKKGHLTDSQSVANGVIVEVWNRYRTDYRDLFDYQLWLKANVSSATADLSNEEFAEVMRLKRNGQA